MSRMSLLVGSASVCALLFATASHAQTVPSGIDNTAQEAAEAGDAPGDIVVTGSRISAAGFDAPTPTTTITSEAIERTAQPNLFNTLTQLPALQGSTGTTNGTQNANTSLGDNGLSALNLRGLGTIRTLTLLDGQRVVPAYITGAVDVSQFPQLLIKKVDVVTGGASASWGSDAVAGVVNFVTDTRFTGFKGNLQGGVSDYGDSRSVLAQFAAGHDYLNDRLHIQVSGEYFNNEGVLGGDSGRRTSSGRPPSYAEGGSSYSITGTPPGSPQNVLFPALAQEITFGRYGLITAGPLQGTAFDVAGNVVPFQYGGSGTPLFRNTPAVAGCVGAVCPGGDLSNFIVSTRTLDNPLRRIVGYGRIGFEITPDIELFGTASISEVKVSNTPIAYPRRAGITMSCSNPFLPASVVAGCASNNIRSFLFGTTNSNLPERPVINIDRLQKRFVGGANGSFDLFGKAVRFEAHYTHGENRIDVDIDNMTLLPRYNAAIQATRNASGQIVCATPAATAAGCLPINVFGGRPVSEAQYRYIAPTNGPRSLTTFKQDAAAISFNATPFSLWAGDVAVALGGEWRRERYVTNSDPYGAGTVSTSLNGPDYPVDPLLNPNGSNWFAGNYKNGRGAYSVKEAFLELGLPIFNGDSIGKFDLNLAGRIADYSTAGVARTWKVGGVWATPLSGLRLRGVVSRDIRAPNLSELFAAPQTVTLIVNNRQTNSDVQVLANTTGNTSLRPEVSNNKELGIVYRPDFLPNLALSVDYFDIKVNRAISTFSAQQIIDLCFNGNDAFCDAFNLSGTIGTPNAPFVNVQPFNLAQLKTRGLDFEASYRVDMENAGVLNLSALATHTIDYTTDSGISGQIVQQLAGGNANDTPFWKVNFTQAWKLDNVSVNLTERWVSSGEFNRNFILCQTNCPAPTVQNPTTNFNRIPGAVYFDVGAAYKFDYGMEVFGRIDNLTNHRIPPFGSTTIYDVIGRVFRFGIRFTG